MPVASVGGAGRSTCTIDHLLPRSDFDNHPAQSLIMIVEVSLTDDARIDTRACKCATERFLNSEK